MKMKFRFLSLVGLLFPLSLSAQSPAVTWDRHSLIVDGHRQMPVMGEIHYSRIPASEWLTEIRKMREGGVTMIATYVFWNHIEEQEGIFDWSGQRSLRRFLLLCQQEHMPVIVRIGPFCHGEVRNGGIPDWAFRPGVRLRSESKAFLSMVEPLYRQIFTQIQGLQWKDGGPVIACQFDNEYRGRGSYLMALKKLAREIGFDLPFYTRTGWPELATPVPFGEMLPLFGDYADGFWDKDIREGAGNYFKAFLIKPTRSSTAIGTDLLGEQHEQQNDLSYPYFTCELGGGMMTSYHKRVYMYPMDAYAMAVVKLASGSNLLGYYMYHGGTNPEGHLTTLNENQRTLGTANNDLPVVTYDFQAPLNEFGQRNDVYYQLRPLHLFMHDYGETLAPMEVVQQDNTPDARPADKPGLGFPSQSVRASADSGFVFFNNYQRFSSLPAVRGVQFRLGHTVFPKQPFTLPAGSAGIFPVNISGIRYATAQLVACREGRVYLMEIPGIPVELQLKNGKTYRRLRPQGLRRPVAGNIYLLSQSEAGNLFLADSCRQDAPHVDESVAFTKVSEAGPLRTIVKGKARVAEAPSDDDFRQAAVYRITLPDSASRGLLSVSYHGDCARLYARGRLIEDNFYNGRPMQYGLWRLPADVTELELRILPLQPSAPIYFPREADRSPGEGVNAVTVRK